MATLRGRRSRPGFAPLAGLAAAALLVAGCVGAGSGAEASSGQNDVPGSSPSPSAQPGSGSGFYLRAWQTQALAPDKTFSWLPLVTIADGVFIDGNIAIPMIYPGPVYAQPVARPISDAGIAAIASEARNDGLLDGQTGCGQGLPGSMVAHLQLTVDGNSQDLSCALMSGAVSAAPGASSDPGGFESFWSKIQDLSSWLGVDLGTAGPYIPVRLAVLLTPPAVAQGELSPTETGWPLAGDLATFGAAFSGGMRCGVVSGADLATLLPVVRSSNQLTVLVDGSGGKASLDARALVPGEPDPCSAAS